MSNFKFIRRVSVFLVLVFALLSPHNISLAQEEAKPLTNIYIKDVKVEKREGSIGVSVFWKIQAPNWKSRLLITY